MTFNETNVNRDRSGKFDTKLGSAATVSLAALPERERELRERLANATPGTNGADIAYLRGQQELEDAARQLPLSARDKFVQYSKQQPTSWIAGQAENSARAMYPHSREAAREMDDFAARATYIDRAVSEGHVRYGAGELTLDAEGQRSASEGLSEMLNEPLPRDSAHLKDFTPERKVGVSGIIRVAKTSVSGNVTYHVETDRGRSLSLDQVEAERLLDQLNHDIELRARTTS